MADISTDPLATERLKARATIIVAVIGVISSIATGAIGYFSRPSANLQTKAPRIGVLTIRTSNQAFPSGLCNNDAKRAIFELGGKLVHESRLESEGVHGEISGSSVRVQCYSEGPNNSATVVVTVADADEHRAQALTKSVWDRMN